MERNFKCRDCGTYFTADDSKWVDCPKCGKDNIEIAKTGIGFGKIAAGVIAVLAIVGATALALHFTGGKSDVETVEEEVVQESAPLLVEETEDELPVTIDITPFGIKTSEPKVDKASRTYSVNAEAIYLPEGCSTEYKIYDYLSGKLMATNVDGHFSGLSAASDEVGTYTVTVYALRGGAAVDSATCDVTGCVKLPDPSMAKLTVAQVQTLVNKAVSANNAGELTGNEGVSPELSLSYDDLRGEYVPTTVSGMLSALEMLDLWSGYTVVSLGYDSMNRVDKIALKPIWK